MLMAARVSYMLPTLVAVVRHVADVASVTVINILLGWSVFVGGARDGYRHPTHGFWHPSGRSTGRCRSGQ
jgi:hypothetical protein